MGRAQGDDLTRALSCRRSDVGARLAGGAAAPVGLTVPEAAVAHNLL